MDLYTRREKRVARLNYCVFNWLPVRLGSRSDRLMNTLLFANRRDLQHTCRHEIELRETRSQLRGYRDRVYTHEVRRICTQMRNVRNRIVKIPSFVHISRTALNLREHWQVNRFVQNESIGLYYQRIRPRCGYKSCRESVDL